MGSRRAGHDWATELNWHDAIGKEPTCQCSRPKDVSSIPGWGRSSGEGNGNPLQFLAWRIPWTEEPGRLQSMGSQSRTRLTWLSTAQHSRVYMSMLLSQCIPLFASHAVSTSPFSTSVSLFLPCKQAHQYHFSRFHICALTCDICFSSSWLTSLCILSTDSVQSLSMASFTEPEQNVPRSAWKHRRPWTAKRSWEERWTGATRRPELRLHHKVTVIKTVWHQHKKQKRRPTERDSKIESPEIDLTATVTPPLTERQEYTLGKRKPPQQVEYWTEKC